MLSKIGMSKLYTCTSAASVAHPPKHAQNVRRSVRSIRPNHVRAARVAADRLSGVRPLMAIPARHSSTRNQSEVFGLRL
ncbi:hypothetical protein GCM10025787_14770 [Saccharopolyspora rosea]